MLLILGNTKPVEAYEWLVKDKDEAEAEAEMVTLDEAAGRLVATGIVPYPLGIPLVIPAENIGAADGPFLAYLKALESFDLSFLAFTHDTHGIEAEGGVYRLLCLK